MSRVRSRHPDDFSLLCFTAGELEESENAVIRNHVDECGRCLIALTEIRIVDSDLRPEKRMTSAGTSEADDLPPDDPFRARPVRSFKSGCVSRELAAQALESSQKGVMEVEALLAASAGSAEELQRSLGRLSFGDPAARYLLLYALEESGRRLTEGPARFLRLAEEALTRLSQEKPQSPTSDAEVLVPLSTLIGQAHLLAGQGANWTGELEKARRHFEDAYRSLQWESDSDEIRIALTEYGESQRRTFAGAPAQGLVLVRRAQDSFDRFGLEDFSARARVAEGIALSLLGRDEEALVNFRSALPVFEAHGLWTNSVAVVNDLGFCLARLGRLEEARREFSRALKKVSRAQHPSLLAFIRYGLARVLFFGGDYADAAKSFSQAAGLFQELEQTGDVLAANLWEIESWARSGDTARARHRLEIFRASVDHVQALDPFIGHQLEDALSGRDPDLERIAELRGRAETTLREQFEARIG
jgi:tetratricopeptide (TPR) repeat protein